MIKWATEIEVPEKLGLNAVVGMNLKGLMMLLTVALNVAKTLCNILL